MMIDWTKYYSNMIDYFFSSYYLSTYINGKHFNKIYDKNKAKIIKVVEHTLEYCKEHNLLNECTKKKFLNKANDKILLWIEMEIEESNIPNFSTHIVIHKFLISKNGFLKYLGLSM